MLAVILVLPHVLVSVAVLISVVFTSGIAVSVVLMFISWEGVDTRVGSTAGCCWTDQDVMELVSVKNPVIKKAKEKITDTITRTRLLIDLPIGLSTVS